MELIHSSWFDIQMMPYKVYMDHLIWKIDMEKEKAKKIEERAKQMQDNAERNRAKARFENQKNKSMRKKGPK
jgi:hypothetical protein